jgi:xanthine/uracil permease
MGEGSPFAALQYGPEARPPAGALLLFGLQWFAVLLPSIAVVGQVLGTAGAASPGEATLGFQKLSFVAGVHLLAGVLWGHRLPLISGPATVLLVGVLASRGFSADAVSSSILIGGVLLAAVSLSRLFDPLQRLFTPRVVAVVLALIGFALLPAVSKMILGEGSPEAVLPNLGFSLLLLGAMVFAHARLKGLWRSTLLLWGMAAGTLAYLPWAPAELAGALPRGLPLLASPLRSTLGTLAIEPGVLLSFLFCFFALSVNDVASLRAVGELLRVEGLRERTRRGVFLTGLGNVLSGWLGVVGPVHYSLSPGVIAASGCASRFALIPTAAALLLLAFSPASVGWIGATPAPVMGTVLLYALAAQVAAGVGAAAAAAGGSFSFEDGLRFGLPLLLATFVAFLPAEAFGALPPALRPLLGNGFVVGVTASLLLEHAAREGPGKNDRLL